MAPLPPCSAYVQSRPRTLLETYVYPIPWLQNISKDLMFGRVIALSLLLACVPQYYSLLNFGVYGVSPWFMVFTCLFATTQLASRLINPDSIYSFNCVNDGKLRGSDAFSALLGYIQAASQWLGAIVLYGSNLVKLRIVNINNTYFQDIGVFEVSRDSSLPFSTSD